MSNMKRWLRDHGISYRHLAFQLGISDGSVSQKVNGKTSWQYADRRKLNQLYGLSSDFIDDFIPYEKEFPPTASDSITSHAAIPIKENALSQVGA